ncbi:hypothetical protein GcM1_121010 [Golovinomyces cichoracearum]|uniref:Uncharacterized protein n=1 Tax=Golovinomyces cichoracearum TaxID=62708 RepID=A0A420JBU6_9PEZI|nr:hypothetical protein GcM1_121010 [Golovinomyces cichoracearum]
MAVKPCYLPKQLQPEQINPLSNLVAVLRNGSIEAKGYLRGLMQGQNPKIPTNTEFRQGTTSERF